MHLSLLCCEAGILSIVVFALSRLSTTVTKMSSFGSFLSIDSMVSSNSWPSPSRVGKMTVTSAEVKVGFSGGGMGLKVQKAHRLTTKRK